MFQAYLALAGVGAGKPVCPTGLAGGVQMLMTQLGSHLGYVGPQANIFCKVSTYINNFNF